MLSERTVARGACFADYDNDGKVDAYLVNLDAKGKLVHNVSDSTGHWIGVKLVGAMRPGDRSQTVGPRCKKQSRRNRRDGGGFCGRQTLDGRARGRIGIPLAK